MIYLKTGDGRIIKLTEIDRFTIMPKMGNGGIPRRASEIDRWEIVGKWIRSGQNVTVSIATTKKEAEGVMTDIANLLIKGGAQVLDYSELFPL